jgi:hypothetical protein
MVHGDRRPRIMVFRVAKDPITLSHDDNLLTRNLVPLKGLPDDPFRLAI